MHYVALHRDAYMQNLHGFSPQDKLCFISKSRAAVIRHFESAREAQNSEHTLRIYTA